MRLAPPTAAAALHRRRSVLALAALIALAGVAAGQDPPGESTGDRFFIDAVDVTVVNVDVYVTDKNGNRVTDLDRDDFEVLEDGKPVEVTNFFKVEGGVEQRPAPPPAETVASDEPPPLERQATRPPRSEEHRLHLIVYFDNLYLRPFNRNKVIREVRSFLRRHVGPDDLVMLVTHERALHVRHPFTSDQQAIVDQLLAIQTHTGLGVQGASARQEVIRGIQRAEDFYEAESLVDFYAREIDLDLQVSLDNLQKLIGSLAGLPGRKALLYVSDGIPLSPGEDLFYLIDLKHSREGVSAQLRSARYRSLSRFREVTAQANANRVTFYTLEAAGLRSHGSLSAEYGGSDSSYIEVDVVRTSNEQAPLQMLAEDTGGLAAFNTNNIQGALERMAEDFQWYYSLGYVPSHGSDGRYHTIEVRTRRRDLELRHRTGYRARSAESRVRDGTLAALLYRRETNPIGVTLELEGIRRHDGGNYLMPVAVKIPLGNVTLVPATGGYRGQLTVTLAAIDSQGELSPVELTHVPIEIPPADLELARSKLFTYAAELLMEPGEQVVAVGVYDEIGGTTAFVRRAVRIGG